MMNASKNEWAPSWMILVVYGSMIISCVYSSSSKQKRLPHGVTV
jgi:hypothetical protein